MKTIENARIRVSLPDEDWRGYVKDCDGDEVVARGRVLSRAMSVLAHAQEFRRWEAPEFSDWDVREHAARSYVAAYIQARYPRDAYDDLCAWLGGRVYECSPEFVELCVRGYQQAEHDLTESDLAAAREEMLAQAEALDRDYHRSRGTSRWDIRVIGVMPTQIGLCDYNPAGTHGALRCGEVTP